MVSTFAAFSPGLPKNAPPTVLPVFGPPRVGPLGGMVYISINLIRQTVPILSNIVQIVPLGVLLVLFSVLAVWV